MHHGTVQWFDISKGFGFIRPDDSPIDIFVHHSEIRAEGFRTLTEGQRVEFEIGNSPKGPAAKRVQSL